MSYLGFTGIMSAYCSMIKDPWVLEIGVDKGQTALPLLHNLTSFGQSFKWIGVDVRIDGCVAEQLYHMGGLLPFQGTADKVIQEEIAPLAAWNTAYIHHNSLDALPLFAEKGWKFDLVLIDGDHNYATVIKELAYLKALTHPSSLIFVDDYCSSWKDKDLYYKDRSTHSDNDMLDKPEPIPGKVGVNQAVDDWIQENPDWDCTSLIDCALIRRKDLYIGIGEENLPSAWAQPLHISLPEIWHNRLIPQAAAAIAPQEAPQTAITISPPSIAFRQRRRA